MRQCPDYFSTTSSLLQDYFKYSIKPLQESFKIASRRWNIISSKFFQLNFIISWAWHYSAQACYESWYYKCSGTNETVLYTSNRTEPIDLLLLWLRITVDYYILFLIYIWETFQYFHERYFIIFCTKYAHTLNLISMIKIPQSGICPALCALRQCSDNVRCANTDTFATIADMCRRWQMSVLVDEKILNSM